MRESGLTLLEILVVMAILAIVLGIAFVDLRPLNNPIQNGFTQTLGFFQQVRSKAMATTSAYRVVVDANGTLQVGYARRCSDTVWTPDNQLAVANVQAGGARSALDLREQGLTFGPVNWQVCFNSRGLANFSQPGQTIRLQDNRGNTRQVEVMLGGGVRQP